MSIEAMLEYMLRRRRLQLWLAIVAEYDISPEMNAHVHTCIAHGLR
jgi:hypothetical protein